MIPIRASLFPSIAAELAFFIALALLLLAIFAPLPASAEPDMKGAPCRAMSGTVLAWNERTGMSTVRLESGGTVALSILCLPDGATPGSIFVHGELISNLRAGLGHAERAAFRHRPGDSRRANRLPRRH